MSLTAEEILALDDMRTVTVEVPEWNTSVKVRTITGAERDAWELSQLADRKGNTLSNLRASFVAITAVKDDGTLIFTPQQVAALGNKSAKALDRIYTAAATLNGLTKKDEEELAKN